MGEQVYVFNRRGGGYGLLDAEYVCAWYISRPAPARLSVRLRGLDSRLAAKGNRILIVSDRLPPWTGFLWTPDSTRDGILYLTAESAEKKLSQRVTGSNDVLSGSSGEIASALLAIANAAETTGIASANVDLAGAAIGRAYNLMNVGDALETLATDVDMEWWVSGAFAADKLDWTINWQKERGAAFSPAIYENAAAGARISNVQVWEEGDIANEIIAYGQTLDWAGDQHYRVARDEDSISVFGLVQDTVAALDTDDDDSLLALARAHVGRRAFPRLTIMGQIDSDSVVPAIGDRCTVVLTAQGYRNGIYDMRVVEAVYSNIDKSYAVIMKGGPADTNVAVYAPLPTYSISGTVLVDATGLSGVNVALGAYSALTDANGDYSITGVPAGTAGDLTPTKTSYTFTPASIAVSAMSASLTNQDFAAEFAFAPSSIPGYALDLDFSNTSNLFQDAAGATPVTADGDPIGLVMDISGNGLHFTQAGDARPLYKTGINGINSLGVALFAGSHSLIHAAAVFAGASAGLVIAVVRYAGGYGYLMSSGDDGSINRYISFRPSNSGAPPAITQCNGDTADTVRGNAYIGTSPCLLEYASDGEDYEIRSNGDAQSLSVLGGANSGDWFGDTDLRDSCALGCLKYYSREESFLYADLARLIVYSQAVSGGDLASLRNYLNDLYSIY